MEFDLYALKVLIACITSHYIADFTLNNDFIDSNKGKNDYILFAHCFIWAGLICYILDLYGVFHYWKFPFLLIGHFFIDRYKARKQDKTNSMTKDLWIDQFMHFIQILIVLF